jgi:hypothetical protein
MMRLFRAAGLLLLLTTASAFGTVPPSYYSTAAVSRNNQYFAFVRGGHLHASTVNEETTIVSTENLALLSKRGQEAIKLLEQDEAQRHVVGNWPAPGMDDDGKIRLSEQVRQT